MYIFILVSFYLLVISDEYAPGHIWKYISGQMPATAHDLGPQRVTFGKGNPFI